MDYINRLKNIREDKDLTQEQIAKILGIKQSAYSKYEKRRTKLQIDDLIILCKFYNVSADYVLGLTNKKP